MLILPGSTFIVTDVHLPDESQEPNKIDNFAIVNLKECSPTDNLTFLRCVS